MIKAHKSCGRSLTGINNNEQNPRYTATELRYKRLSHLPQVMKKDYGRAWTEFWLYKPCLNSNTTSFHLFWQLSTEDYDFSWISWTALNIYLWKNKAL